jgi:hypothetical protein
VEKIRLDLQHKLGKLIKFLSNLRRHLIFCVASIAKFVSLILKMIENRDFTLNLALLQQNLPVANIIATMSVL